MARFDRTLQAWRARVTGGLSAVALSLAGFDWAAHLADMPGRQAELVVHAWRNVARLGGYAFPAGRSGAAPCGEPRPATSGSPRRAGGGGRLNVISQSFLLTEERCQEATTDVPGVSHHHESLVSFPARQLLDTVSPSNFPWTNPEVQEATVEQHGANLVRGARLLAGDCQRLLTGAGPRRPVVTLIEAPAFATCCDPPGWGQSSAARLSPTAPRGER